MWPFSSSKPVCPIETESQQWIDARFAWLEQQFGSETPRRAKLILPTPEFFPDEFRGEPDDVCVMMGRVANYMGVLPERLEVFIYSEAQPPRPLDAGLVNTSGTAGLYLHRIGSGNGAAGPATIGIEASQLDDPMSLVATMAHEIGHLLLLGEGRISHDAPDHEPLTDLLTVFLGLGIFVANATIRDGGWSDGLRAGWSTRKQGYLDQRMHGYALAKFAMARGETRPAWMKHVRPDVRVILKQSLRFLAR